MYQATKVVEAARDIVARGYLSLQAIDATTPIAITYSTHIVLRHIHFFIRKLDCLKTNSAKRPLN